MSRPAKYITWTDGNAAKVIVPSAGLKTAGWTIADKPYFQNVNWLLYYADLWVQNLDITQLNIQKTYDAIVGSTSECTHSTLQAAINSLLAGGRIFVKENATINTTIVTTGHDDLAIIFKDGVTYTNGVAGVCIDTGSGTGSPRFEVRNGRFVGFTIAINLQNGAAQRVTDCRFNGCSTDVFYYPDIANTKTLIGNMTE